MSDARALPWREGARCSKGWNAAREQSGAGPLRSLRSSRAHVARTMSPKNKHPSWTSCCASGRAFLLVTRAVFFCYFAHPSANTAVNSTRSSAAGSSDRRCSLISRKKKTHQRTERGPSACVGAQRRYWVCLGCPSRAGLWRAVSSARPSKARPRGFKGGRSIAARSSWPLRQRGARARRADSTEDDSSWNAEMGIALSPRLAPRAAGPVTFPYSASPPTSLRPCRWRPRQVHQNNAAES